MVQRRIAISAGSYNQGGIGTALLALAGGLLAAGHQVDVLTTPALERPLPDGATLVPLGRSTRAGIPTMARYFRTHRPDVVIIARDYVGLATDIALRLAGRRKATCVLWTFHTMMEDDTRGAGLRKRLSSWLARGPIRRAAACIGVSDGVARAAEARFGLPTGTVHTLPNAVWSAERLAAATPAPRAPAGQKRLLCCARLVPQKDLPTLIAAFALVRARINCHLQIAGEGPDQALLQAKIGALGLDGHVTLLGQHPECLSLMQAADCLVLSSRFEGSPVVLVEGLVIGLPIVATNCPSGPAEILQDGALGTLVPVGDAQALAQALIAALDPAHDTTALRAARQQAALGWRADVVTARYEALITKLCT